MNIGEGFVQPWQGLFFDFDGVLVDSVGIKTHAFGRLFESYGPEIMEKVVAYHLRHSGVSRMDKFRYYYEELLGKNLEQEEMLALCQRFARLVVDEVVAAPEIPGAEAFLRNQLGKVPMFVVSATPEEEIREIVSRRNWSGYFRDVRGAPRSKQENLNDLLTTYGISPELCWFIGDAESDYRAAYACGVNFLGIVQGPDSPLLQVAPQIIWRRDFIGPLPLYPGVI